MKIVRMGVIALGLLLTWLIAGWTIFSVAFVTESWWATVFMGAPVLIVALLVSGALVPTAKKDWSS